MKYIFFKNVTTMEELRRQYKALCMKYHPDKGGKTEDMQKINAEYEELRKTVGNRHESANGEEYERETDLHMDEKFREIINKIISFDCIIEICGSWIWVRNAFAYKDQLKELGFFWCSGKKSWAWTDNPVKNKHKLTMEEIRDLHGSDIVKNVPIKRIKTA